MATTTLTIKDANGSNQTVPVWANASGGLIVQHSNKNTLPTYSAAAYNQTAVASSTDVVQFKGSATATCYVTRVSVGFVPGIGTAASQQVALFRRSTAAATATTTALTTVASHIPGSAAASAVVAQLTTTAASAGTPAGTIRADSLSAAAATGTATPVIWTFDSDSPLVVSGILDFITIGFAGVTPGANFSWSIQWFEIVT